MANQLFDLSNQVALITGSSRGIGKSIAEEMSAAGAKVVISSRKQEACDQVRDEIRARGREAISIACNIGHKEDVEGLVKGTLEQLGRIDIVVCNAAVNPFYGSLMKLDDDAWDKTMNCNVKSGWWLTKLVVPHMVERGSGNFILISSIGALVKSDNSAECRAACALAANRSARGYRWRRGISGVASGELRHRPAHRCGRRFDTRRLKPRRYRLQRIFSS